MKLPSPAILLALLALGAASPSFGQVASSPSSVADATSASPTPTASVPSTITPAGPLPPVVSHIRRLVRDIEQNIDNIKSQGNFGAQLWLVSDEAFFQDWRKPEAPTVDPVELVSRGQSIFTAVIFYGPGHDDKGLSNVSYDITVHRPDGSVYNEQKDLIGYQNLAPADDRLLILGRKYVTIDLDPSDPPGKYTVEAVVHDNVGRVELPLKQSFIVQGGAANQ